MVMGSKMAEFLVGNLSSGVGNRDDGVGESRGRFGQWGHGCSFCQESRGCL